MATSVVPGEPGDRSRRAPGPCRTRVQLPGMIVTGVPFSSHDANV